MKNYLVLTAFCIFSNFMTCLAQNVVVKGIVLDATNNEPLGFASVALINSDSVVVTGCMSDVDGHFEINAQRGTYIIKVSFIGYKEVVQTSHLTENTVDVGTISLHEDATMLQAVEVRGHLPKTVLKGDAVVTNIEGTILEHTGNANDVLAKVPGMIDNNGKLEVIGRGTPVYYINGRKITDDSELRNLMSEDINSVDVVSNPGALYGGDVRCIVRIKTVKRQGEGFSYALTSQAKKYTTCRYFDPSWTVLDINYRTGGWDFFGKFVYWAQHNFQLSDVFGSTYLVNDGVPFSHIQDGTINAKNYQGGLQYVGGINWQINPNQSLGIKLDYANNLFGNEKMITDNDVIVNGVLDDHLTALNDVDNSDSYQFTSNIYYDGTFNKLNINFNADFMQASITNKTDITEASWHESSNLSSRASADVKMGAAKLVISYPVWKGSLQVGSEETYFEGSQQYKITKEDIPSADSRDRENTIAAFAQYSLLLPFGQFGAGLRYEHVNFSYYDDENSANNIKRRQDDWFPSLNFSTKINQVGISLGYTGKTHRPSLNNYTNELTYINRYTYQTGNPLIKSSQERTVSLNANWKWITLSSAFESAENSITQWASPYNDKGIVILRSYNLDDTYNNFSIYLNASPTLGVWNPRYTVAYSKPHLRLKVTDQREPSGERIIKRNTPMYMIQANNAFQLKHNWLFEVNYQYISTMSEQIASITKEIHEIDLSVQKSFLKDNALTLKLSWIDVLATNAVHHYEVDYGAYFIRQTNDRRNPGIFLRASYRFNSAQSKYKGTGAGQSVKERM
ncbi:MAG: TonB-dependent receptor family protein [Bacteroidaceae bacterium]|nr:TonB-dependent receptor family protein [Bacteroidaceae bacterium]